MKFLSSVLCLACFNFCFAASHDAYTRALLKNNISNDSISVFVQTEPGRELRLPDGIEIVSRAGNVLIVKGCGANLSELSVTDGITGIYTPRKLMQTNDIARSVTGADALHAGVDNYGSFDGSGVITGIFDSGFDLRHPAFLNSDGRPRTERILHYTNNNASFTDYSTPLMVQAFITDSPDNTHGTHVLGTMAGGNTGLYDGMAPGSTPIVACGQLYDVNIADGISRIVDIAEESGRPCVINLSLSDEIGPHDGSDPMAALLTELSKKAVIVISAGNSAGTCASISKTFTQTESQLNTFVHPSVTWTRKLGGACGLWSSDERLPELEIVVMNWQTGTEYGRIPVNPDEDVNTLVTDDYSGYAGNFAKNGIVGFNNAFSDSYVAVYPTETPQGRAGYQIEFMLNNTDSNERWTTLVGLALKGENGQRIDINIQGTYCELNSMNVPGWTTGGDYLSVNSMGCGEGPVVVGAWTSRNAWTDISGNEQGYPSYAIGDIAPFSSYATLPDGRSLPHCIAPGAALVSAMSTPFYEAHPHSYSVVASSSSGRRNNYWMTDQGTSMSAPVVAGGIAMWLQADPTLNSADIHEVIAATSQIDEALRNTPPVKYGAGKFNALEGLKYILERKAGIGATDIPAELLIEKTEPGALELFLAGANGIEARLYNISGAEVSSATFNNSRAFLDTRNTPSGIYILRAADTVRKILL